MSEIRQNLPILNGIEVGDVISNHHGVRCYPAMGENTDDKYILKVISIPSSQTKLDAMLLTGVYPDVESALRYFKELAQDVVAEVDVLKQLSELEGFVAYEDCHLAESEDNTGYEVYLLKHYKRTLLRQFSKEPLTQLGAINLGLDICAALTVARRAGYLYVDLKPENIFITGEKEYKLGDLGFVRLDSLKYATLDDKYRSQYTPPEVLDDYAPLNETMDVYAAGLILYQAYNNGELPVMEDDVLPPPQYADYEMAEIILKACAKNPEDRWESPIALGQALVGYMQRNGANDTPIIPPAPPIVEPEIVEPTPVNDEESVGAEVVPEENDDTVYIEDCDGNFSFLADAQTLQEAEEIDYDEVSPELTEILVQADDLVTHDVPDPVVQPEPIDVPIPEPISPEEPEVDEENADDTDTEDAESEEDSDDADVTEAETETEETETPEKPKNKKWLKITVGIVLALAILAAGVYFVLTEYLLPIEGIRLEGSEDGLTVYVTSDIQDDMLSVVCSDSHGNRLVSPVIDGKAVFTDLVPDTAYKVKVQVSGFHRLTGDSSTAYSTPIQTNIIHFSVVTGAEDGSVIIGFTVDGPDSENWSVAYAAPGEEEKVVTFPSHMVTISGLTVGKEYTFTLTPETNLFVSGDNSIVYTASTLIYPQDLTVTSCLDGKLTAAWRAPKGTTINQWTVRCYNDDGYNETQITDVPEVTFEGTNDNGSYTVEVIAEGMSVGTRAYVAANSVTASNIQIEKNGATGIKITWETNRPIPEKGWLLFYSIDGSEVQAPIYCSENSAVIQPIVPGAEHKITLQDANGNTVLGTPYIYTADEAEIYTNNYDGYTITGEDITLKMCKRPDYSSWNRYYLSDSDYTSTFTPNQKVAFVAKLEKMYGSSRDGILILYVVRDEAGNIVSISSQYEAWNDLWYYYYGEFNVPQVPTKSGTYTMDVFFNSGLVHSQDFTITQ